MDIENEIKKAISAVTSDKNLVAEFKKDPMAAAKKLLGDESPEELVQAVATAVKTHVNSADLEKDVEKGIDALKGLLK